MATKLLKRHGRTTSDVLAVEQPSADYTRLTNPSAPRSRGQYWDDVTPSGGGSSFAHLVENGVSEKLLADWPLEVDDGSGSVASVYASFIDLNGSNGAVHLEPPVVSLRGSGDVANRIEIYGDTAEIMFGGGVDAPDAHLARSSAGRLKLTGSGFQLSAGGDDYIDLAVGGANNVLELGDGTGFSTGIKSATGGNVLEVVNSGGASALRAHSPDGTAYTLTPPNGGGAAVWV